MKEQKILVTGSTTPINGPGVVTIQFGKAVRLVKKDDPTDTPLTVIAVSSSGHVVIQNKEGAPMEIPPNAGDDFHGIEWRLGTDGRGAVICRLVSRARTRNGGNVTFRCEPTYTTLEPESFVNN